jgi:hypothetical protein
MTEIFYLSLVVGGLVLNYFLQRAQAKSYRRANDQSQRWALLREDEIEGHPAVDGLPAKDSIFVRLGKVEEKLEYEFSPNEGKSTFDRLVRIEAALQRIEHHD